MKQMSLNVHIRKFVDLISDNSGVRHWRAPSRNRRTNLVMSAPVLHTDICLMLKLVVLGKAHC